MGGRKGVGELRWWSAVRSYPHPESRAENSAVYVSEVVPRGGDYVSRCWSGKDWAVVVWLLLLRRVVTSKPPPSSHRHCHKQTGRPSCLLDMACSDVTCKQASEVWYSDYGLTAYIAGDGMRCQSPSRRVFPILKATSRIINANPHQALMFAPTLACPELLTCFSLCLTKPRDGT